MRNDECTITISNKNGVLQWFEKLDNAWWLHAPKGALYRCTAEQFISHLLPALMNTKLMVEVQRKEMKDV